MSGPRSKKRWWIAAVVALLAAGGGVKAWWELMGPGPESLADEQHGASGSKVESTPQAPVASPENVQQVAGNNNITAAPGAHVTIYGTDEKQDGPRHAEKKPPFPVDRMPPVFGDIRPVPGSVVVATGLLEVSFRPSETITEARIDGANAEQRGSEWVARVTVPASGDSFSVLLAATDQAGNPGAREVTYTIRQPAPPTRAETTISIDHLSAHRSDGGEAVVVLSARGASGKVVLSSQKISVYKTISGTTKSIGANWEFVGSYTTDSSGAFHLPLSALPKDAGARVDMKFEFSGDATHAPTSVTKRVNIFS